MKQKWSDYFSRIGNATVAINIFNFDASRIIYVTGYTGTHKKHYSLQQFTLPNLHNHLSL